MIILLAASNLRSRYYLQSLLKNKHPVDHVLLLGTDRGQKFPEKKLDPKLFLSSVVSPNETIEDTCSHFQVPLTLCPEASSVNSEEVQFILNSLSPSLVLYSGFSGEIVSESTLETAPFLHCHPGRLPDFRGSTTIYYSILKEYTCHVTAFILNKKIDQGIIVGDRSYPVPPKNLDLDYTYDNAIRADLMTRVVKLYMGNSNSFPNTRKQLDIAESHDYYIIHPVLKRLAVDKIK